MTIVNGDHLIARGPHLVWNIQLQNWAMFAVIDSEYSIHGAPGSDSTSKLYS